MIYLYLINIPCSRIFYADSCQLLYLSFFYIIFFTSYSFKSLVLAAAPDKPQTSPKIRNPQNFQFSFTKTFEYEILFFPSKILKPLGEREYDFFKNPIFPQKPRGIPKHSRF